MPIARPMREEDALGALETLGLTGKEAKAYLALVQNGVSSAVQLAGLIGVQYPAVYRILHSLQEKGWAEASRERPNRYRARNPRVVAEEARQGRAEAIAEAAERAATLVDEYNAKVRASETDLFLYKGPDSVAKKLQEIVLSATGEVLVVSPAAVDAEVLRLVFPALRRSRQRVRVLLNQGNASDVARLRSLLGPPGRVDLVFPPARLPGTRLSHTFVFPSDKELFILNSFYRDGGLVLEKLQGLWIGDADYVRLQLEAMVRGFPTPRRPTRRVLPRA